MNPIVKAALDMNMRAENVLRNINSSIPETERLLAKARSYSEDFRDHELIASYETHLSDLKEAKAFFEEAEPNNKDRNTTQNHPTSEQVKQALNVIERADADDAMTLMVCACVAAAKHGKAKEAAVNLEVEHENQIENLRSAFNPFSN